jgi:hypothetical protein
MRMRYFRPLCICVLLCLSGIGANAQRVSVAACDANLGKSVEQEITNDAIRISWLYSIDEDQFHKIQQGVDTGGSVLVNAIPISGYGNWNDFRSDVVSLHEKYQHDYSEQRSRAYVRSYFSETSETGYAECLKTIRSQSGVTMWIAHSTDNSVVLEIQSRPPDTKAHPIDLKINEAKKTITPAVWSGNLNHTYSFARTPGEDFSVVVNLGNGSDSLLIPAPPKSDKFKTSCTVKAADLLDKGIEHYDIPTDTGIRFSCAGLRPGASYVVGAQGTIEALFPTSKFSNRTFYVGQNIGNGDIVQWWVDVGYKIDGDESFHRGLYYGAAQSKSLTGAWANYAGTVPASGIVAGYVFVNHSQISPDVIGPVSVSKDFIVTITTK